MLAPPYASKEERAAITDWLAAPAHETDVAGREEVLRFVLAGGMDEATFDRAWAVLSAVDANSRAALSGAHAVVVHRRQSLPVCGAQARAVGRCGITRLRNRRGRATSRGTGG